MALDLVHSRRQAIERNIDSLYNTLFNDARAEFLRTPAKDITVALINYKYNDLIANVPELFIPVRRITLYTVRRPTSDRFTDTNSTYYKTIPNYSICTEHLPEFEFLGPRFTYVPVLSKSPSVLRQRIESVHTTYASTVQQFQVEVWLNGPDANDNTYTDDVRNMLSELWAYIGKYDLAVDDVSKRRQRALVAVQRLLKTYMSLPPLLDRYPFLKGIVPPNDMSVYRGLPNRRAKPLPIPEELHDLNAILTGCLLGDHNG